MAPRSPGGSSRHATPVSYTTQRALRTLELLVFSPATAPQIAAVLGVHARTARRTLKTLASEQYVVRSARPRPAYRPTVRLLALAAQLAERLPIVIHGRSAVAELSMQTGVDAALVVPSYEHVLVLAAAGRTAPQAWSLLPAATNAGGRALLAERPAWRESLGCAAIDAMPDPALGNARVIRQGTEPLFALCLEAIGERHVHQEALDAVSDRLQRRIDD